MRRRVRLHVFVCALEFTCASNIGMKAFALEGKYMDVTFDCVHVVCKYHQLECFSSFISHPITIIIHGAQSREKRAATSISVKQQQNDVTGHLDNVNVYANANTSMKCALHR